MIAVRRSLACVVFLLMLGACGEAAAQASFKLPFLRGGAMLKDGRTLVVSVPSQAMLVYYDTVEDKELMRPELDFKPTFIAVQGDKLFVATDGGSKIHVLEAATAKELGEIRLPGEPVQAIACHTVKGLVYVTNLQSDVYAIDPDKLTAVKTKAAGQYLAVDPSDGKTVYTGIQKPIQRVLVVEEGPANSVTISLSATNIRGTVLKFKVDGSELKFAGANKNACVNGKSLAVSPDGKQVAYAGAGGWRSLVDARPVNGMAVFDSKDMSTRLGQVDSIGGPHGVAYHPDLKLGAVLGVDAKGKVTIFSTKSFVTKETIDVNDGSHPSLMLFGAHGTKLIYGSMPGAGGPKVSTLEFIPLKLTDADRETLKKASAK